MVRKVLRNLLYTVMYTVIIIVNLIAVLCFLALGVFAVYIFGYAFAEWY